MTPPLSACFALLLLLLPWSQARAQLSAPRPVDDIEVPSGKPGAAASVAAEEVAPAEDDEVFVPGRRPDASRRLQEEAQRAAAQRQAAEGAAPAKEAPPAAIPAPAPAPAPQHVLVLPPRDGEAQLLAAWAERSKALQARAFRAAQDMERKLLALREELGYENLFVLSAALAREAEELLDEDAAEAYRRAQVAAQLAPDLPYAHWAAARAAFRLSPLGLGRQLGSAWPAVQATWREPRWRVGMLADVSVALVGALLLGGALTLLLVFGRHARAWLHDLHHLFPAGASRWQTALLAALALLAPLVLGLGAYAVLLAMAVAVWVHAGHGERAVLAGFLALLTAAPAVAGHVVGLASFSGTDAEVVYLAERGGLEGPRQEARLRALTEGGSNYASLFAAGRLARRRGEVQSAVHWLRRAAEVRPDSLEVLVELGNALFLMGDSDGAAESYMRASELAPGRAEPYFNLSRLHAARAKQVTQEEASGELSRAQEYGQKALEIDSRIGARAAGDGELRANLYLLSMPLDVDSLAPLAANADWQRRVEDQVRTRLFGGVSTYLAWLMSTGGLALLGVLWVLARSARASGACRKCGRPVCRRCDAEVANGPGLCGQCLHLLDPHAAVDPPARVTNEMGIRRFQRQREVAIKLASVLLAGAGHVLLGRTALGALLMGLVGMLAFPLLFETGLVRTPAGAVPVLLRVIPASLALLTLYALAIRHAFAQLRASAPKA